VLLTINDTTTYTDFSLPIEITAGDDLLIQWDPISRVAGLGREGLGIEPAGIGGTLAPDVRQSVIETLDPVSGDLVSQSEPIMSPTSQYLLIAPADVEMVVRIVQLDQVGRETEIGRFTTTAA